MEQEPMLPGETGISNNRIGHHTDQPSGTSNPTTFAEVLQKRDGLILFQPTVFKDSPFALGKIFPARFAKKTPNPAFVTAVTVPPESPLPTKPSIWTIRILTAKIFQGAHDSLLPW